MTLSPLAKERIIVAIDVETSAEAAQLVSALKEEVGVFKIGLELLTSEGPGALDILRNAGAEKIFYDVKLHDIPNTVAGAMRGIAKSGAWCVTVHTSGGFAMLKAAVSTAKQGKVNGSRPLVLGVTVLTSISQDALNSELNVEGEITRQVVRLAQLAQKAGCDGVIASPLEISAIREAISNPEFLIVTPGVRPAGSAPGDQARVMTPGDAIRAGASYLVIGRPITQAADPVSAARSIAEEIADALR